MAQAPAQEGPIQALALAALVLGLALAGCVGEPAQQALPPLPQRVLEGQAYAFAHPGGALRLDADGAVRADVFAPDDTRLGQLALGAGRPAVELAGMPPGDYVLQVVAAAGNVTIGGPGGAGAALRPLGTHLERVVLLEQPRQTIPPLGVLGTDAPIVTPVEAALLRPATSLRLLIDGDFSQLGVHLRGDAGTVLRSEEFGPGLGPTAGLRELTIAFTPENMLDGRLQGEVEHADLQGTVVLEARSYSRAPMPVLAARPAQAPAAFAYGELPGSPVLLATGRAATVLILGSDSNATVHVFTASGARLGAAAVPAGVPLAVPVTGGASYILHGGKDVSVGSDAAPAEFALHPIEVTQSRLAPPGGDGTYRHATVPLDPGAVPIAAHVAFVAVAPIGLAGCPADDTVRIVQGGETVAAWSDADRSMERTAGPSDLPLGPGEAVAEFSGLGSSGCTTELVLSSFVPPSGR